MSYLSNSILGKAERWHASWDPVDRAVDRNLGVWQKTFGPVVNAPPTISTASNLAAQQDDLRARQRGVLSNIYAGGNAPAPVVANKTLGG